MNENIVRTVAAQLKISAEQVKKTLDLMEEGGTVPFIARYRKNETGNLDEEQILFIEKQYKYEQKLADRKEAVLKLIAEQGKLTDEITAAVNACTRPAMESGAKPPNTTECTAPMRAQASMA